MLGFILVVLALVIGGIAVALVPYLLAQKNIFWTIVDEGTSKQVLYMGKFIKSLLAKKGHTYTDDWTVVPLPLGSEESKASGLHWVGIWPFFEVDKRTMKFVKALSDGTYERRSDPETDFLLTGTDYQYALLFSEAEDKDKLPLSGQMTMTTMIINPYKALFLVKDWFEALVSRVLPRVREYISQYTYDELINGPTVDLDAHVFEMLGRIGPNGEPSIISILESQYGIRLSALQTVSIDPPKEYREATLRQFNAIQTAKAEAEETGGSLDRMIDKRLESLAERMGFVNADKSINHAQLRAYLQANPDLLNQIGRDQLDLLRRDRAGAGLRDIRVANADGSSLDPATATLMSLIDLWKNGGGPNNTGSKNPSSGTTSSSGKEGKKKSGKTPIPNDINDILDS